MKKKDGFVSLVKGIITGIATLVPGVSTAAIVLSVNAYEDVVESINNITKKDNKAFLFVTIPLIIGLILGLIGGIPLIDYFWNKWKAQTILLFVGLVAGGILVIHKKQKIKVTKKAIALYIVIPIIFIGLHFLLKNTTIITKADTTSNIALLGLITGIGILVPGVSLITSKLSNNYNYIFNAFKHISSSNVLSLILFVLIILLVIVICAKTMYKLIDKTKRKTYIILCSLMISSIATSLLQINEFTFDFVNVFTSVIALLWGFIFSKNVVKE